jgi:hypothetical protein
LAASNMAPGAGVGVMNHERVVELSFHSQNFIVYEELK